MGRAGKVNGPMARESDGSMNELSKYERLKVKLVVVWNEVVKLQICH